MYTLLRNETKNMYVWKMIKQKRQTFSHTKIFCSYWKKYFYENKINIKIKNNERKKKYWVLLILEALNWVWRCFANIVDSEKYLFACQYAILVNSYLKM